MNALKIILKRWIGRIVADYLEDLAQSYLDIDEVARADAIFMASRFVRNDFPKT
jgi:hypothetical protein